LREHQFKFILASASPRRSELLRLADFRFEIIPSTVPEIIRYEEPSEIVMDISLQKAMDVASKVEEDAVVLGCDTMVFLGEHKMGKPKDEQDAFAMINNLQQKTHQVYSGVTLLFIVNTVEDNKKVKKIEKMSFYEKTDVVMYPMTEIEIENYIATKEPMDKAGAYAIQGKFAPYIKEIHGDYNNVVGLPLARICMELKKKNFLPIDFS